MHVSYSCYGNGISAGRSTRRLEAEEEELREGAGAGSLLIACFSLLSEKI